jgi:hypothetical protein
LTTNLAVASTAATTPNSAIEHRDNKLAKHLKDTLLCPNAPQSAQDDARDFIDKKGKTVATGKKRKAANGPIDSFLDRPLTLAEEVEAELLLLRAFVSANWAMNSVENHYFRKYLHFLRPSYTPPTRYVLSGRILDAEAARVEREDMKELQSCKLLTLLIDGWEDLLRRSIYGTVASQVSEEPIVMTLEDLTGKRGSADSILTTALNAMTSMGVRDSKNFIAVTTDNPTTMISF